MRALRLHPNRTQLDASAAAVNADVAVGGFVLLLRELVVADGVGLVLECKRGSGGSEEAEGHDAAIGAE